MNFKFNWLKGIVSLVAGIVIGMLMYALVSAKLNYCPPGGVCPLMYYSPGPLPFYIIGGVILVYAIWSLLQKK